MTQKFSYVFNPNCFHDQICLRFDMRFIGRVLHNFTFHDNFSRFSDVYRLPRDVEEIMQFMCPAFHVYPMSSSKFVMTDSYMYQNK